jgi:putative CocE/NonD family hydrolase
VGRGGPRRGRTRRATARAALLTACALALLLAAPAAQAWTPRAAKYGVAKQQNVPITMSDGTRLFADVLRPAGRDGKPVARRFPVILTQTPYNKTSPQLNFENDYLVERGYVQVIVDVRGTGSSEGMWDSFGKREQRDGFELARWVHSSKRPWSNGRVGLFGASYGGINQIFTAAQHPPGLKGAFTIIPMSDSYRDITGSGGQLNTAFIPSWLGLVTALGMLPPTYAGSDPITAATTLASHSNGLLAFQASTLVQSSTGGDTAYDGPFYRERSPIEVIDRVKIPMFIWGGWFDLFQRGEPLLYQHLRQNHVPTRLLMGPWYHLTASSGDGLPADGVPAPAQLQLRWFDRYVRGSKDPTLARDVKPVTYDELGYDHYRRASAYPFKDVRYRAYALSGAAAPGSPGKLVPNGVGSGGPDSVPYDPSGVCTRSTVQWTAGAGSGTPCEDDDRVNNTTAISYDLKPPKTLRIGGTIAARLFVSTSAKDGLVAARVEDVDPAGKITQLTAGWQVLSLRALAKGKTIRRDGFIVRPYHPFTKTSKLPVKAGQPMEVYVEIFPTAAMFKTGHKLRLTLQSGDAPHLTPPLPQFLGSFGGTLKVWHDAKHPSQLILPIRGLRKPPSKRRGGGGGSTKPRSIKCHDKRKFTFHIGQPRHGRIVRVEVYVNGKLRKRVRRHRVRKVTISKLPKRRFKVRIVAHWNTGQRTISTRTYKGCRKSRPRTHVER